MQMPANYWIAKILGQKQYTCSYIVEQLFLGSHVNIL
jgi:hypothetical protein